MTIFLGCAQVPLCSLNKMSNSDHAYSARSWILNIQQNTQIFRIQNAELNIHAPLDRVVVSPKCRVEVWVSRIPSPMIWWCFAVISFHTRPSMIGSKFPVILSMSTFRWSMVHNWSSGFDSKMSTFKHNPWKNMKIIPREQLIHIHLL